MATQQLQKLLSLVQALLGSFGLLWIKKEGILVAIADLPRERNLFAIGNGFADLTRRGHDSEEKL